MSAPLRLDIDLDALAANWRWFRGLSAPARCGAAVKADGYGLGMRQVVQRLLSEGCRDFFVTTYDEAEEVGQLPEGALVYALHGFRKGDRPRPGVVPVLNTPDQIARWRQAAPGAPCDVKVDTGMNRLGLDWRSFSVDHLEGLNLRTLHSHLACADEPDHPLNRQQLQRFRTIVEAVRPPRASLCGSGGICLGPDYVFDLTRPGLGIYGGVPNPAAAGKLRQVVSLSAEILQVRDVAKGETAGYNATWTAPAPTRLATANIGYGDGFSNGGKVRLGGEERPVVGRVSMDLIIVDLGAAGNGVEAREGDWLEVLYDLPAASALSGLSQYELLTGLGHRYQRRYR